MKQKLEEIKKLKDFKPTWNCRFHPTDWWHEVGCPHQEWTKEQLKGALEASKQSNAYLEYLLSSKLQQSDKKQMIMVSDCCHSSFSDGEDENSDGWIQCDKCGNRCNVIQIESDKGEVYFSLVSS